MPGYTYVAFTRITSLSCMYLKDKQKKYATKVEDEEYTR